MKITQYIGEITGAFSATIKHAFAKRDTVLYPEVKPDIPGRWRGRIILTKTPKGEERCVACYLCSSVCPAHAITIQGAEREEDERKEKMEGRISRGKGLNRMRSKQEEEREEEEKIYIEQDS